MKSSKSAFTLLEIMIAASILTVWVFGIYKMISSNMVLLSNFEQKQEMSQLFSPLESCLKNIWYDSLSGSFVGAVEETLSFHFWDKNLDCMTGSFTSDYSFTWVVSGNNEYFLYAKKLSSSSATGLEIEANIYSPTYGQYSQSWERITIQKN